MASPLRNPLSGLVWAAMAVIYLPLLPASGMLLAPAFSLSNWAALFADPQLPQALAATLVSTLIATLGSLFIALSLLALLWPGDGWQRLSTRLPWLLAVPHVAFATSALLLFAEGGQFYRICTVCSPQLDRYGIGLGLTLAVKESAFVLWAIYAALPEKRLAQQKIVLHTFGYGRMQALNWLVLPAIAPALARLVAFRGGCGDRARAGQPTYAGGAGLAVAHPGRCAAADKRNVAVSGVAPAAGRTCSGVIRPLDGMAARPA